jgi:hypothetical protein
MNALKELDPRNLYRLFVDGRFYVREHGWEGYEKREPGSIEGMSLAYTHMVDNFDLRDGLSFKYICDLHNLVISKIDPKARKNRYPGQVRQFRVSFLLKPRTCSIDGITQLLGESTFSQRLVDAEINAYIDLNDVYRSILKGENVRYIAPLGNLPTYIMEAMVDLKPKEIYLQGRALVQRNITSLCHEMVDEYNSTIGKVSGEGKLYFLVDWIKRLIRIHPFVDGNARVFINILLNHLLLYHGFNPVIYEEPSIFDGRSTEEILVEVRLGQNLFQSLLDKFDAKVFNHSISDENTENNQEVVKLMASLSDRLSRLDFEQIRG